MDISGTNIKHITMFDRQYTPEKQAEGLAISQAIVYGHCDKCGFLSQCSTQGEAFRFPVFAWCMRRKAEILAKLEQVKAEKDAAVESIPHECKTCVYHTVFFNGCTLDHDCTNPDGGCSNNNDRWKWRGQKEE